MGSEPRRPRHVKLRPRDTVVSPAAIRLHWALVSAERLILDDAWLYTIIGQAYTTSVPFETQIHFDKEFCNKYYLATHRAAKHGHRNHMLSSQAGVDLSALGRAADAAPTMDVQQFMIGLEQSTLTGNNALRSLYLSQMGMGGGSPSPSSVPSSGSASITGGSQDAGPEPSPTATTPTSQSDNSSGLPNWFSGLLPPQLQQQGLPSNMSTLLEQMQAVQNLQLFGGNLGGNMGALAAALSQNPASFLTNTPNKASHFDQFDPET
ncbi:unnamed protein product [Angiostrongylus costaricensis]|uniref:C2H2-type domain-containing protein n=1 Tax=Angiostrongylus costaricensis TaxID=334426 RepID=A0A0R3PP54_ANGCS|nr:unnamed protein product [Angiostrongylus costaricensis]